jgi:hypothetical protein
MIYKALHRKLKSNKNPTNTVDELRFSGMVSKDQQEPYKYRG